MHTGTINEAAKTDITIKYKNIVKLLFKKFDESNH